MLVALSLFFSALFTRIGRSKPTSTHFRHLKPVAPPVLPLPVTSNLYVEWRWMQLYVLSLEMVAHTRHKRRESSVAIFKCLEKLNILTNI